MPRAYSNVNDCIRYGRVSVLWYIYISFMWVYVARFLRNTVVKKYDMLIFNQNKVPPRCVVTSVNVIVNFIVWAWNVNCCYFGVFMFIVVYVPSGSCSGLWRPRRFCLCGSATRPPQPWWFLSPTLSSRSSTATESPPEKTDSTLQVRHEWLYQGVTEKSSTSYSKQAL